MRQKMPNPTDRHVGQRVRARRMQLDLSQSDLGLSLGVTFQQVQKYEKGSNRIGSSRLHHIAELLNVPVAFFFEGLPNTRRTNTTGVTSEDDPNSGMAFLATRDGQRIVKAFQAIKEVKTRVKFIELVESLAGGA